MTSFIDAVQFLTIFRFRNDRKSCPASSAICFPFVGAFLGVILIVLNEVLTKVFPELLVNLILVTVSIILTGALHLDGLADTCDAFFSGKNRDDKLLIMRDPHKGTFGVLGLSIVILFKINLLALIPVNLKDTAIFLMMVFSRYSLNIGIGFFPYAREQGKANIFFEGKKYKNLLLATLITLVLASLTFRAVTYIVFLLIIIFSLLMNKIFKGVLGGITGDTIGALCELTEIITLLAIFGLSTFYV